MQELFFCELKVSEIGAFIIYSNDLVNLTSSFGRDVQQERNWEFMMCIRCYNNNGNSKITK